MSDRNRAARAERQRLLVTGFGPFPGVPENASGVIASRVAGRARHARPDAEIASAVLPTEWRSAPVMLRSCIEAFRPHAVVHLGISARAWGLVVETLARNRTRKMADASGREPLEERVVPGGPGTLRTAIAIGGLVNRLQMSGLPVARSNDAGRYICNAVYYHSLGLARRSLAHRQVVLVHLPTIVGTAGAIEPERRRSEMAEEPAIAGLMQVIELCLAVRAPGPRLGGNREG
jgi:pyroglutamyl-peptidase